MSARPDAPGAPQQATDVETPTEGTLGDRLREIFSDIAAEPIPPSFDELLRQLD